jgi:carbonic anhydrase
VSSSIDELLENAAAYAAEFAGPSTHVPSKAVAIVTCMDTRINGFRIFGLEPGDAHVLRNAGGLVTDDVLRSLVISQRLLGTREVMLVHHTKCGLHGADDAALRAEIAGDVGRPPPYQLGSSTTSTTRCARRLRACAAFRFSRTGTASVDSCTTSIPAACAK